MPSPPTAKLKNIPAELRNPPLWLQYYLKPDSRPDKKPRKQPIVKWSDKANLRSLDYLLTNRAKEKHDGFQRYIDKTENFVYVDLDHCRTADTGEIEEWARAIVTELDSYCEISASGKGLHIVCRATLPEDFHVDPKEIYSGNSKKLMAMTGDVLESYTTIHGRQERIEKLLARWKADAKLTEPEEKKIITPSPERHWRDVFHLGSELDNSPSQPFIQGILDEGITYFGAHSGTGKTWIGLSISHALLSGQPLFGVFKVLQRTNVLYLVPEMGGRKFWQRMKTMRISMDGGFYCQTIRDGAISLDDPALLQAIHMTRPAVILDTAIRFQEGDEQSSTQQAQGLGAKMFRLIREGAACVIGMHHRKKDLGDVTPTLQNTLRGTGDFGAQADCVWCVEHSRRKKGRGYDDEYEEESKQLTRLTLTCVKPRDMEPAEPFTIQGRPHIDAEGDFAVLDAKSEEAEKNGSDEDNKVIQLVQENPKISYGGIRAKTGFGADRIRRILQEKNYEQKNGQWEPVSEEVY